jgi:NADPH-dependent glutamate synthase beta subunit-like oxidoreductase
MVVQSRNNWAHYPLNGSSGMSRIASDLASSQVRLASSIATRARKVPKNVGIIGAGVAGLRCADVLLNHGVNVTIIEGRDRLGGRVSSCIA